MIRPGGTKPNTVQASGAWGAFGCAGRTPPSFARSFGAQLAPDKRPMKVGTMVGFRLNYMQHSGAQKSAVGPLCPKSLLCRSALEVGCCTSRSSSSCTATQLPLLVLGPYSPFLPPGAQSLDSPGPGSSVVAQVCRAGSQRQVHTESPRPGAFQLQALRASA